MLGSSVFAKSFKVCDNSCIFSNGHFSSKFPFSFQVDTDIVSECLILHTLVVDAVTFVGTTFSPTIKFMIVDFPELVSP